MLLRVALAVLAITISTATAYYDNCDGSSKDPSYDDCLLAVDNIHPNETYINGHEFSYGNCFLDYDTNGTGDQPIDGKTLIKTAEAIMDTCPHHHGSFWTKNCYECHVTINYRVDPDPDHYEPSGGTLDDRP